MKNFLPFTIIHIDLSKQKLFVLPATNNKGNYIVLWWREIALGDFYIEPNERLSEEEYRNRMATAILPVINSYIRKTDLDIDWNEFLLVNKIQDWSIKMEPMFSFEYMKEKPERVPVSVIICTRNRPSYVYKCLGELRKAACLPQEIIVVDNASSDNKTREIVKQFPEVIYVAEPRIGLDIARNTGISKARCSIVAFTDDDVLIHPLWVYRVWETFQTASVAAMTGLVIAMTLDTESQFIFEKYWSFNRGYLDKIYDKDYFSFSNAPPVWEIGAGANMAFRKSIFEEVGYFHELLDVGAAGCNGDSEMWFRILAKGNILHYNPRAVVYHEHRRDIKALRKQIFNYMRGFTAAALWQQRQLPKSRYNRYIFLRQPMRFASMLIKGFPKYHNRYKTLWVEIKGVISGIVYFYKKENRSSFSERK